MHTIANTSFSLPKQQSVYRGKVRDVYTLAGGVLVMVATDRISAFDCLLHETIPHKGQVLNQLSAHFLKATASIVPNWLMATPDPVVSVGHSCTPFRIEMVIRGYLVGHAYRTYRSGKRLLCGVALPDGLHEYAAFPSPIITPTIKAETGHDEDISREEIIEQGIVSAADYAQLERYTYALFERGTEMAAERGLVLADTKYEFGKKDGTIYLIDEVHTPDSSRYFYAEEPKEGAGREQLSKEFVREWLLDRGFQGGKGQVLPHLPAEVVQTIADRYKALYEQLTGVPFVPAETENIAERVEHRLLRYLNHLH